MSTTHTVLVRNPDRFGAESARVIRAVGQPAGKCLRIPLGLYESIWRRRVTLHVIDADYDPARDKDRGRCCS